MQEWKAVESPGRLDSSPIISVDHIQNCDDRGRTVAFMVKARAAAVTSSHRMALMWGNILSLLSFIFRDLRQSHWCCLRLKSSGI
jgi:hypothetical protein